MRESTAHCPDQSEPVSVVEHFGDEACRSEASEKVFRTSDGAVELQNDPLGLTERIRLDVLKEFELRALTVNLEQIAPLGENVVEADGANINEVLKRLSTLDLPADQRVPRRPLSVQVEPHRLTRRPHDRGPDRTDPSLAGRISGEAGEGFRPWLICDDRCAMAFRPQSVDADVRANVDDPPSGLRRQVGIAILAAGDLSGDSPGGRIVGGADAYSGEARRYGHPEFVGDLREKAEALA
jgi:hypothetical protein